MTHPDLNYRLSAVESRDRDNASKADAQVEALIDSAGRDKVFAKAKALGWGEQVPPKWVWVEIALDLKRQEAMQGAR